jgi:hypothetical protein
MHSTLYTELQEAIKNQSASSILETVGQVFFESESTIFDKRDMAKIIALLGKAQDAARKLEKGK